ncbi:MAG: CoA transferase [Burkholderiales bacterium]|nr:CoA transferase [Burkholderiales bacterium]
MPGLTPSESGGAPGRSESGAAALAQLWSHAGLPQAALQRASCTGTDPVLASSFAVGTAAQACIAAAALAATEVGLLRNAVQQQVCVDMLHAALECCSYFRVDGRAPDIWDKLSGLYPCGDDGGAGWVRIHTNFAHHRDAALRLLRLPQGDATQREAVQHALRAWRAADFEAAAADAGAVVAALRSFDEWDEHAQGQAVARQPLLRIERIGDAPPRTLPPLARHSKPLHGLRVLDLTRILAGPVGTRALAAYGADVLLVNAPHLPNIEAIADTSRGKLSAHADLRSEAGRAAFDKVLRDAHVFVQGYRPGALARLGYAPQQLAVLRPGIVAVSLSAYGNAGPWSERRGFDSLVQTATGFNLAEALAFGSGPPRALPMQVLDHATGYLMALGAQATLLRQMREGGSWHVQVSLAATGQWLRGLGRVDGGFVASKPDFKPYLETSSSGFGELTALRHAAQLSVTPAGWDRPSVPPGTHALEWPGA